MSLLRSTLIATFLLHLFLYQSPLSNAIRSLPTTKENDDKEESLMRFSDGLPAFAEAPEYRNGAECPIPSLKDSIWSGNPSHIQIAMTIDMVYLRGTMAAILSVLKHASCPENIFFHFIAAESDSANSINYSRILPASFPSLNFKVYIFREEIVKNLISSSIRRALDNPLNYARNYLTDILDPCVQRVIYLDSDVIVVDDIQKLWNTKLTGSRIIGAPEYCHANFTRYFSDGFWSDPAASRVFEGRKPCYFNTGVMVMDLERWREGNYRSRIEGWMKLQKQRRIYQLGSLPPFLLVFAGNVEAINHRWNQHGLGGDNLEGRCRSLHPGPVSLLHWSGKGKPWVRLDARTPCLVDHLWAPYDLYIPQQQQQQPKSWISYSSL